MSCSRRGFVLGLAAALAVAMVALDCGVFSSPFDVNRWQQSAEYRRLHMAEEAGALVRGLSVEEAVHLLGEPDDPRDLGGPVLRYRLSESCGSILSLDPCDLMLFVTDETVSGAAISDTGSPPGEGGMRCVAGVC